MEVSNGSKAGKTRLPRDVPLNQWLSARGGFCPPGDTWQYLGTLLVVTPGAGRVLLASSGWRQGVQLNFPQCTRWPPQHRSVQPQGATGQRLRKPDLDSSWKIVIDLSFG